MRCPTLKELPPPPEGKIGWPWTEESEQLPDKMPDGSDWPKISIVTPNYNYGLFIEETIRSVLLQGYPNLEYIVIDGASTDDSVEIIKKYEQWLAYWVSEKDKGQTNAINKGMEKTSGDINGYLNSDDLYLRNAFKEIGIHARKYYGQPILIVGNCSIGKSTQDIEFVWISEPTVSLNEAMNRLGIFPQPATFWTVPKHYDVPYFNESFVCCMDYDFWCHLLAVGYLSTKLDYTLSFFREHNLAKSSTIINKYQNIELSISPLFRIINMESLNDKQMAMIRSRKMLNQYLRAEIEKIFQRDGSWIAFRELINLCFRDLSLLMERPTLGLIRKLIFRHR